MKGLHYVLHAPQGDTYADLLFTMIERRGERPPVTYTTFQARDLGTDTAELFKNSVAAAHERFKPQAMIVGASCTAELIQDDPADLPRLLLFRSRSFRSSFRPTRRRKTGALPKRCIALCAAREAGGPAEAEDLQHPRPDGAGFRNRDDVVEVKKILASLGIEVLVTAPMDATPADIARLPEAEFNVSLYPEISEQAARYLEKSFGQKFTTTIPIGVGATRAFIAEVAAIAGVDADRCSRPKRQRLPWYSRSVDSTYLTGKRVFIFGDATHAMAAAKVARDELAFQVVGLGTYSRELARPMRELAREFGLEALITDDYLEVEKQVAELHPDLVLGSQMERHIAKRLGVPCAVISAPVHVQDFPARYSPQMGFEGANVIFDTWVHPLMMGLEEHLLHMFRDDFEFHEQAAPSHLGHRKQEDAPAAAAAAPATVSWLPDAEDELKKIPFFVRKKARRNTEAYAAARGLAQISVETLYDAKAHYSR